MMEFKLSKSIESHEGKVDTITLREPTGGDLRKLGMPFEIRPSADIDAQPTIELKERVALDWVTELSDHDEAVLDQCHPADLFQLMWACVEKAGTVGNASKNSLTS